jgi:hypothetical protein
MTTIFTDDFTFTETEVHIDDPETGYEGRDLIFTGVLSEVRLRLPDEVFKALGEELIINGLIEEAKNET